MNRFKEPTQADEITNCCGCDQYLHVNSLYLCQDDEYRCEDCFQQYKEKRAEKEERDNE